MNRLSKLVLIAVCSGVPVLAVAQNGAKPQGHGEALDAGDLLRPLGESWPTYSGDYSGKRYSTLTQINQANVKNLALAWVSRVTAGPGAGGALAAQSNAPGASRLTVGGEGSGDVVAGGATNIRSAVLAVNGILYFTTP